MPWHTQAQDIYAPSKPLTGRLHAEKGDVKASADPNSAEAAFNNTRTISQLLR